MNETIKKLRNEAIESFPEGLSDMDYSYNPETKKFDIPAVEWDGIYGKHWERFDSEEARTIRLDRYSKELDAHIAEYVKEGLAKRKEARRSKEASKNTLGNLFPELAKLKG